ASQCRLDGYRAALEEAGLAFDPALVAQGDFTYRSGLAAAGVLLDAAAPPTALFASNDDMAAAALAVARARGLDVPGDLSVCGFDDTPMATTIWPELTTIRQPVRDMARAAVEMLVARIRDQRGGKAEAPCHRLFDFALVCRQSDAPARV
ncbi:MAG TPA: substrate-binding domain-containing protein, partial [Novosphingobium sp.]|nr:substrate-binding domain-containing protein [Novosphingobium sp.]